jgi:hypothetical protein
VLDGALKAEVREPPGPVRALHLDSPLVLGQYSHSHSLVKFTKAIYKSCRINTRKVDLTIQN